MTGTREVADSTQFTGVRVRFASEKSHEELVSALLADIGDTPVPINDLPSTSQSWEAYERQVQPHIGPSGFTLFSTFDHGAWLRIAGINRKVLRVILGNPLIAITMIRHDVTAALFAPVELLLLDEPGGRSSITYVRPSSLMVVEENAPLLAAAEGLDAKLEALVAKVASA
jgi:uncharacterized protein (DUF302 family)